MQRSVTREEDQRAGLRYLIGTLDDHGKDGKTRVNGDAKCALVERQELALGTTGSLGEHHKGISACCGEADPFDDCLSRGTSLRPIDLDDPDRPHGVPDQRDLEQFRLREETAMDGKVSNEERDIEHREMVRNDDVSLVRIDLLDTRHVDANRRNTQPQPGPVSEDSVMDGRSWAEGAIDNYEGSDHECEKKEQWNEHKRSGRCKQSAKHGR